MTATPQETGITSYLEELQALAIKYKSTIACGDGELDATMSNLFEGSYRNTVDHMVKCEVMRNSGVSIDGNGRVTLQVENCKFVINPSTLEWAFSTSTGVTLDTNKVENDIVSTGRVASALTSLCSMSSDGRVDLLDYVSMRVEFIVALLEEAKGKLAEVNTMIAAALAPPTPPAPPAPEEVAA